MDSENERISRLINTNFPDDESFNELINTVKEECKARGLGTMVVFETPRESFLRRLDEAPGDKFEMVSAAPDGKEEIRVEVFKNKELAANAYEALLEKNRRRHAVTGGWLKWRLIYHREYQEPHKNE